MLMSGNLRKLNAVSLCYNNTLMESVYYLYNIVADSQWASTLLKCKASMVTDGQVTLHLFVHTAQGKVSCKILDTLQEKDILRARFLQDSFIHANVNAVKYILLYTTITLSSLILQQCFALSGNTEQKIINVIIIIIYSYTNWEYFSQIYIAALIIPLSCLLMISPSSRRWTVCIIALTCKRPLCCTRLIFKMASTS